MLVRPFGDTGLSVSALGFGASHVGDRGVSEADAARVLQRVLDAGITFLDTAPSYGSSEERIGRHLAHRRDQFVLSTKGGYGVAGVPDWTYDCITRGAEQALGRLRTDRIDVFFLHSCPEELLRRDEVLRACEEVVRAGKVRVAGYSGEQGALAFAVRCGVFGAIQCSVNVCDQGSLEGPVREAARRGLGVVAKRPLANAPWQHRDRPAGLYGEVYWERMQALALDPRPFDWDELFLRFSVFAPGVSTAIAGSRREENLQRNLELVSRGPLPPDRVAALNAAFGAHGQSWPGQI